MPVPTRPELDALVRQRIAEDPGFRDRLLADPGAAVAELTGIDVPDVVTITVHEESLTDVHLVIPGAVDEISEEDLELVAGGDICWADYCGVTGPH